MLETKTIKIGELSLTITQLSALDQSDFIEALDEVELPKQPLIDLPENASQDEMFHAERAIKKYSNRINRLVLEQQALLVAYGLKNSDEYAEHEDIQSIKNVILKTFSSQMVTEIHNEVAVFSGIPLPENQELDESSEKEPIDPK
jgi:hypothetical protein